MAIHHKRILWVVGRVIFFGIGSGMVSPALGECPEEIEELGVIL